MFIKSIHKLFEMKSNLITNDMKLLVLSNLVFPYLFMAVHLLNFFFTVCVSKLCVCKIILSHTHG